MNLAGSCDYARKEKRRDLNIPIKHMWKGFEPSRLCMPACRFYPSLQWYLDIMLSLIERAGEYASKDVWHSTVQLITNYPELHAYAARKVGDPNRKSL